MTETIVTERRQEAQEAVVIHDLRNGQQAKNPRIGDYAVTESGLHVIRGGDGHKPMRLWKVRDA